MESVSTLAAVAGALRRRAGQRTPAFSTRRIVQVCFPNAIVTGRSLPEGVQEIVSSTDDGPIIVYARGLPTPMQRFAIAHAIGHLLFDMDPRAAQRGLVFDPRREARADQFATELLVPLDVLRRLVRCWPEDVGVAHELYLDHVDEIASCFGVPSAVIDMRIRELESLGEYHAQF